MRREFIYQLDRREFLQKACMTGTALYLGMGGSNGFAATDPPPETTTLRIRVWRPSCWAPVHVAEPLLKKEGFTDIQYVSASGPDFPKMLEDNAVDISPEFIALGLTQIEKKQSLFKFLSGLHVGCYAIIGSKRINTIGDLKGKTVWAGSLKNNGPHIFFSILASYVGLDPRKDVNYAWVKKDEAMRMFKAGKIDAVISFPPGPQELIANNMGRILIDTNIDRPWSQYFCCMVVGRNDFIKNNPIATKRALRAILLANDIVARDPEHTVQILQQRKIWTKAETKYILQALKEIPYGLWRDYNPEETIRFNALRLHSVGLIKSSPKEIIENYADWSFINELKDELAMTW